MQTNKFYQLVSITSRHFFIAICINGTLSATLLANNVHSQNLEKCYVSISVENALLTNVFKKIEQQTLFKFSYDQQIEAIDSITLHVKNKSLLKVIKQLQRIALFQYKQINNTIAVVAPTQSPDKAFTTDSDKPPNATIDAPGIAAKEELRIKILVKGKVLDETMNPLPGVNVVEKGTTNGTVTDEHGEFVLTVNDAAAIIMLTSIGYESQEMVVGNNTNFQLILKTTTSLLNEVVVTGYSTENKRDITSSVSQISSSGVTALPQSDVGQALQGRMSGAQVTTSGQPGTPSEVRIRGFGSFGNNQPLIVIDGVPTLENSNTVSGLTIGLTGGGINTFANINPYDVESITVLKDAGSASIYGSRASNGVMVITTRHGQYNGKTKISLDINSGVTLQGSGLATLNPQLQADKTYEAFRNGGVSIPANSTGYAYGTDINNPVLPDYINVGVQNADKSWIPTWGVSDGDPRLAAALANYNIDPDKGAVVQVVKANKSGTDWYKACTRAAPVTRMSLGISGGNEKAHYYSGFAYMNQQGVLLNQYMERYNFRINSEVKLHRIKIGENFMATYKMNPTISFDQHATNIASLIYRMPRIIPAHDVNGNLAGSAAVTNGMQVYASPLGIVSRNTKDNTRANSLQLFGNTYLEFEPFENFILKTSFGGSIDNYNYLQYLPKTYENQANTNRVNSMISEQSGHVFNWAWTNTATYKVARGQNGISALLGYEAVKSNMGRDLFGSGINPYSSNPNYFSVGNSANSGRVSTSALRQPFSLASLFFKVDYNWSEKYYLSGLLRHDGSSVFGGNNRFGVFPAASGAWRLSSEKFMSSVKFLQEIKIRGSYGIMGNQNILPTNQFSLYTGGPINGYDFTGSGNSVQPGLGQTQVGNPDGKWESNTMTDVGVDANFGNNGSWEISLDCWQKTTTGLLVQPNIPTTAGAYTNNPYQNVGKMLNQGIDLQLSKKLSLGAWKVHLDGNFSVLKNRIVEIANDQTYFDAAPYPRIWSITRNSVDQPISSFFGYQVIGYFKNANDVTNSPAQDGAAPGRFKYADINNPSTGGKGDHQITPDDRKFLGSPVPKFTYGLNLNVTYKRVTLTALAYGVYGNKIANLTKWFTDFYASLAGTALGENTLTSWTPQLEDNAKTPIIETTSNISTNNAPNSWYLESGSYLRLKNLQIAYNLPDEIAAKAGLQKMSIYFQAVNLFTITKYTGQNPELTSNSDTVRGIDFGNYPISQFFGAGLSLTFKQ